MLYFWNSGSEKQVLLKGLSNSKELEKPSATIEFPGAVLTPASLVELNERIGLAMPLAEAFALVGLDTSSQATVKINQGNPKTTAETFFADKVKAKISTKGFGFLSERTRRSQVFTSDQPVKRVSLFYYLRDMHLALREEDGDAFVKYSVSLLDENLKVVLNNQSVKRVLRRRRTINGREINYSAEFASGAAAIAFSGTCIAMFHK